MICGIAQGTFAEVFKAREKGTKSFVALKTVSPKTEYGGIPLTAVREIGLLKKLNHENIVCFIEGFKANITSENGQAIFYIALEYCEFSLEAILNEKRLQLNLGAKKIIMKQLFCGLLYLHQNSILHRDIKSTNLLITKGGILKIADFGLGRSTEADSQNNKVFSNSAVTLWYRAPELLLGECCYTSAIDMWSSGCVMAELWNGSAIMQGTSEQKQLFLILKLCGSISEEVWPRAEKLPLYNKMDLPLTFRSRIKGRMGKIINDDHALDLFDKILTLDPEKRFDAGNALKHKFFWEQPYPESFTSFLVKYQKLQLQPKPGPQTA